MKSKHKKMDSIPAFIPSLVTSSFRQKQNQAMTDGIEKMTKQIRKTNAKTRNS